MVTHARLAGESRLASYLVRQIFGTNEDTIVTAVKPVPVRAADDARAEEAIAVG